MSVNDPAIQNLDWRRLAPLLVIVSSGGLLAAAFWFEIWGGLRPCTLCVYQRWPHAVAIILAGLALGAPGGPRVLLLVMVAIALWSGGAIAGFHVGVEQQWWPGTASCGATTTPTSLQALMAQLQAQPIIRCDEVAWSLLGLSMAAYNLILSLLLGGLILAAAGLIELRRTSDDP